MVFDDRERLPHPCFVEPAEHLDEASRSDPPRLSSKGAVRAAGF
jgi:hypothetical protein